MKKQCVLLTALVLACGVPASFSTGSSVGFTAMAQSNGKVSGVVKDADGEPLIGVTVRVKGTQRGTVTDINGNYSIQASKNQTLVFSYVGYKATEVSAANAANVVMNNDGLKLDEVVITGEFGMKRVARAVGSSAQNVKAVDITESGRTDFISALQGRVSGMTVTSSGGAPGASTSVVLFMVLTHQTVLLSLPLRKVATVRLVSLTATSSHGRRLTVGQKSNKSMPTVFTAQPTTTTLNKTVLNTMVQSQLTTTPLLCFKQVSCTSTTWLWKLVTKRCRFAPVLHSSTRPV